MKKHITLITTLLLGLTVFAQTSTTSSGAWNTGSNWDSGVPTNGEQANVDHAMTLDGDLDLSTGANYIVGSSGSITDVTGGTAYNIDLRGNANLTIGGNISIEGYVDAVNGANITILAGDTLFVGGDFEMRNTTTITIEDNAALIVYGNMTLSNSNGTVVNGNIVVYGNLETRNTASVTGTGNVEVTGTITTNNSSTVFGSTGNCSPGPCELGSGEGLPISLVSFEGAFIQEGTVQLEWVTETELNNDFFTIYYSYDGQEFFLGETVYGAGNSNKTLKYAITIKDLKSETIYFKLMQTDFDGSFEMFNPIVVKNELSFELNELGISVYPNPGNGNSINIDLSSLKSGDYQVLILNELGQVVKNNSLNVDAFNNNSAVELLEGTQLNPGLYFIQVAGVDFQESLKYIVQ